MDDPLLGTTLGSYQVISPIAQGGMARIYLALQPSLNRHIALKVLLPQFTFEPEFLQRFKREALSAARLNHPNIVHVYDAGEERGYHYIAMEFVDGGTLENRLEAAPGRPLPPDFILSVMDQVCAALDYAHAHGIVHRDIKPSNVLLKQDGRAVLSDFGIAKAFEGTQWVKTMSIIGTPEYMSPEQAQGQTIDHRTDIYSLGVILYQMLTGRVPFQAETPWAVIHQHIYEPLPPIQQVNPGVPAPLAQVVHQALAKEPGQRYARAGDLAAAVRSTMPQELPMKPAVSAPTPSPTPPPSPPPPVVTPLGDVTEVLAPDGRPAAPGAPVAEKPPSVSPPQPRRRGGLGRVLAGGLALGGLLGCLALCGIGAGAAATGVRGFWPAGLGGTGPTAIEATVTEAQPTASSTPAVAPTVTKTSAPTASAQTPAATVTTTPTRTVGEPMVTPSVVKATATRTATATHTATSRPTQPPPTQPRPTQPPPTQPPPTQPRPTQPPPTQPPPTQPPPTQPPPTQPPPPTEPPPPTAPPPPPP